MILAVRTTGAALWRLPSNNKAFRIGTAVRGMAAVKELSWCAASDSPNRRRSKNEASSSSSTDRIHVEENNHLLVPIESFGIVAAMAKKSRVIGINGKLPWNLPQDRALFKRLTANKILVIGRRTLEEEPSLCHIAHAAHSIIVSTTLTSVDDVINRTTTCEDDSSKLQQSSSSSSPFAIHIVRSFPEALDLARTLEESSALLSSTTNKASTTSRQDEINCWVAGGERLYEEALLHPSAKALHLTIVDVDIDVSATTTTTTTTTCSSSSPTNCTITEYARFPAKYRWDHIFRETSRTDHHEPTSEETGNNSDGLKYEHYVFERFVR